MTWTLPLGMALVVLAGCSAPAARFQDRAAALGFQRTMVAGIGFEHVVYWRAGAAGARSVHLYIDGDGLPVGGRGTSGRPHAAQPARARADGARSGARRVPGPSLLPRPGRSAGLRRGALDGGALLGAGGGQHGRRRAPAPRGARRPERSGGSATAGGRPGHAPRRPGGGDRERGHGRREPRHRALDPPARLRAAQRFAQPGVGPGAAGARAAAALRGRQGRDRAAPGGRRRPIPPGTLVVVPGYDHRCCWAALWPQILRDAAGPAGAAAAPFAHTRANQSTPQVR